MNIKNKKNLLLIILLIVLVIASILRLNKLGIIPPSLSWDEAANGYNAWTISNYGHDEWGNFMPAYFKSFLDYKHPVHIYITAIFVKILGLSEFSTRLPSAFLGILNVLLVFLVAKKLFRNNIIAVFSSLSIALSPYAIHFSRFNHEANFALFFLMLGIYLFLEGLEKKNFYLALSFLFFGIDLLTYHSAKVVVPPLVILLVILNFKKLKELKIFLISGFLFLMIFISLIIFNPDLLGFARAEQTALSQNQIHDTYLYQKTQNDFLGRLNYVSNQYVTHFSKEYLFEKGDKNPRLGIHTFGQFYSFEALFLILGFLYLLYLKSKASIILFAWLFLAPLPASLVSGAPDGARSLYLMGSMHLLVGAGIYAFLKLLKNKTTKTSAGLIIIMLFIFSAYFYLDDYYKNYNVKNPTEWQYGMKQVVEYAKQHPEYSTVYMTNIRSQPYIFFLYYLKQPLDKYFQSVQFNYSDTRSFNLVYSFDRYIFDGWDPIESSPDVGKLYILTSSQYDGLRYKTQFKVKEKITYPNGSDNFFIVSVK